MAKIFFIEGDKTCKCRGKGKILRRLRAYRLRSHKRPVVLRTYTMCSCVVAKEVAIETVEKNRKVALACPECNKPMIDDSPVLNKSIEWYCTACNIRVVNGEIV